MEAVVGIDIEGDQACAIMARFDGHTMHIDEVIQGDCIQTQKHIIIDGVVLDRC